MGQKHRYPFLTFEIPYFKSSITSGKPKYLYNLKKFLLYFLDGEICGT